MTGVNQRALFGRVGPHDGETLLSIISRSAEANVHPRLESFLALAGIQTRKPEFVPFTRIELAEGLAQRLGLDTASVLQRTHRTLTSERHGWVDWYGTSLPRVFIDARNYRFSPRSLQEGAFQRACWTVKPLKCCPESMEFLTDICPHCKWRQRWKYRSSMDICEKCRMPLVDLVCDQIDINIQSDVRLIASLIDPCDRIRRRSLSTLPEPFRDWDAGQVFVAIVDLGAVKCAPELARKVWAGDFGDYLIRYLVAGLQLIRDWPTSFAALLTEVVDTRSSNLTKCLGPVSRYFLATAAPSTLRDHIRTEVPSMLKAMKLQAQGKSQHADWLDLEGAITSGAAAVKYGFDKKTVRRLRTSGLCAKGKHLLDDAALAAAVSALRVACTAAQCANTIGLPQCCVPYLATRGLLKEPSNKGAKALAGKAIYDRDSLDLFVSALDSIGPQSQGSGVSVKDLLLGRIHPDDWVDVLQAVLDGTIRVVEKPKGTFSFKALVIDADDAASLVSGISAKPLPADLWLSYSDVGDLIGLKPNMIAAAVKQRLLPTAVRRNGFMRIALEDVQSFSLRYDWHNRAKTGISLKVFERARYIAGFLPVANLAGLNLWLAGTMKKAEPLPRSYRKVGRAKSFTMSGLALQICIAVRDQKLKQPFGPEDVKHACPGQMPQTYKNVLPRYSVGNPSKEPELFQRIGRGRYETVEHIWAALSLKRPSGPRAGSPPSPPRA